jgi:hypothetical protein
MSVADQAIVTYFVYDGTFRSGEIHVIVGSHNHGLHMTFYKWIPVYDRSARDVFDIAMDLGESPAVVHGCKMGICVENF